MKSNNKKIFKSIVKECLLEILAEGLIGNNTATKKEVREFRGALQETYDHRELHNSMPTQQQSQSQATRSSYLDKIKMGVDTASSQRNIDKRTEQKVAALTNDPIMSDILADTARTTLQEQRETRGTSGQSVRVNGDQAAKIVDQSSPEDLFGGQASKWANLAFAPSIRR